MYLVQTAPVMGQKS